MYYEPPDRRRPRRQPSVLDSPIVAGLLAIAVLGMAAAIFLPGLLQPSSPTAVGSRGPSSGTPTQAGPTPEPTFSRPTPSPAPTFEIYVVKTGDTLNSIAKKYRTTARSIAWWNRGAYPSLDPQSTKYDPNTIRRGWKLVVMPDTVVDDPTRRHRAPGLPGVLRRAEPL